MDYTSLIFDLGNVIIPLKNEKIWWEESWCGIFQNPEKINRLREEGFFIEYERGSFDTAYFIQHLSPFLKLDKSQDDIVNAWNSLLLSIPIHRIDFLRQLKNKYNIYLLSNTNEIHLDYIIQQLKVEHGRDILDEVFQHCYYSYKIKEVKPDVSIYQMVIDELNIDAKKTLFMDDKTANLEGAQKVEIQTLHIHPDQDIVELMSRFI